MTPTGAVLPALLLIVASSHRALAENNPPTPWAGAGFACVHFIDPEDVNRMLAMEGGDELSLGKGFALQFAQDALRSTRMVTFGLECDYFYETAGDGTRFRVDYLALSGCCRVRMLGNEVSGLALGLSVGVAAIGWDDSRPSPEFEVSGGTTVPIDVSVEGQLGPVVIEGGYSHRSIEAQPFDLDLSSPDVRLGIRQPF